MERPRYLIIRLSAIGDVLHCTPVVRELKAAQPKCHITWLVGEVPAELLACNPYIDEICVWPKERWEKAVRTGNFSEARRLWKEVQKLIRGRAFTAVLDIHGLFFTGVIARMPHAKQRIGMGGTKEFNSLFMTAIMPKPKNSQHLIFRYLSVLEGLKIKSDNVRMDLFLSGAAEAFACEFFTGHTITKKRPILAVVPATTWDGKNWPPSYFAEAINALDSQYQVLLCGSPGDRQLADKIISQVKRPLADAVGQTSLLELAALIKQSDVLLTGDTGPLHMAIALDVPTVSIFGASDPNVYGPLNGPHIALQASAECAPCNKRKCPKRDIICMPSVTVDSVIQAIDKLISKK